MIRFAVSSQSSPSEISAHRAAATSRAETSVLIEQVHASEDVENLPKPEPEPLVLSSEPPSKKSKKPRVPGSKKPRAEAQMASVGEEVVVPPLLNLDATA